LAVSGSRSTLSWNGVGVKVVDTVFLSVAVLQACGIIDPTKLDADTRLRGPAD